MISGGKRQLPLDSADEVALDEAEDEAEDETLDDALDEED